MGRAKKKTATGRMITLSFALFRKLQRPGISISSKSSGVAKWIDSVFPTGYWMDKIQLDEFLILEICQAPNATRVT
jgi:hypothetical protein